MNNKSNIAIEASNLSKVYTNGKINTPVLNGVDLTIYKGEFISIMGPSGSGKSTLLYLLGGLEEISSGQVDIHGVNLATMSDKALSRLRGKQIGFVFQFYNLVPHLNIMDNVMLPSLLNGVSKKNLQIRATELLSLVGLSDKKTNFPSELSGGQQQRVAIARALIHKPEVLFADEPIGNLDSKSGEDIMELFSKINKEEQVTIVQVTHSLDSASYGDRIISLKDGYIINEVTNISNIAFA